MRTRLPIARIVALAAALLAPAAAAQAPVVTSEALRTWSSPEGWLTQLRRHPDGTASCATAKSFTDPRAFGVFVLRSGDVTLFSLVDQHQPFAQPGPLTVLQAGRPLGTFGTQGQGAALATTEANSARVKEMIDQLDGSVVTIAAAGRQYRANFAGVVAARAQLDVCIAQIAKAVR
jgi:hypothetical protein